MGYESELWATANALRGSMNSAEYKQIVLGLIFLKYISDAFEDKMDRLMKELRVQQEESAKLDAAIATNLCKLRFWNSKSNAR